MLHLPLPQDKKKDRNTILPECEVHGKNFKRCDPDKIKENDVVTCEEIDEYACNKERETDDEEEYCECIGLEYYEPDVNSMAKLHSPFKTVAKDGALVKKEKDDGDDEDDKVSYIQYDLFFMEFRYCMQIICSLGSLVAVTTGWR